MSADAECVFNGAFLCRSSGPVWSEAPEKFHSCFLRKGNIIFRLRKWLVARLSSIIDNHQVKREEDLIMDVAR